MHLVKVLVTTLSMAIVLATVSMNSYRFMKKPEDKKDKRDSL